jgi:hypothetical protein
VYFYPEIDFLYCKVLLEPSDLDPRRPISPSQPILPFLDPETIVSVIRFLVLDSEYWTYRGHRNFTCPIKELRDFRSIDSIFLAVPPLSQWLERRKQAISLLSLPPGDPRADIDRLYATQLSYHASALHAAVPGFRLYVGGGRGRTMHNEGISYCLGHRNIMPDPFNFSPDPNTYAFTFDEYWSQRKLPSVTEVIAAEV